MDPYYVSNTGIAAQGQVGALELRRDHGVLRELLLRFECTDEPQARRELIQLAADLFEVHSAIEAQAGGAGAMLSRECEALRTLLTRAESAQVNRIDLRQALDAYLASEESQPEPEAPLGFRRDADNLHLLRDRARLLDYAEQLLRTH
jgi:hypothetical protein